MRLAPVLWLVGAAASFACGGAPEVSSSDALIGGKLDAHTAPAVGALVKVFSSSAGPLYERFCTATLIAPKVLVTAKHCTMSIRGEFGFTNEAVATSDLVMGTGPTRVVLGESFVEETSVTGKSIFGLGSDVAVVHLKEAYPDVTPITVGAVDESDVGIEMTAVGYGLTAGETERLSAAERRSAPMTVKAISGPVYAPLVSFEDYNREYGGDRQKNQRDYTEAKLLRGYELSAASDEAQLCVGDSGGPLLRSAPDGQLEVVGVASFVLSTPSKECAFGTIYARFGPKARALIDRELDRR